MKTANMQEFIAEIEDEVTVILLALDTIHNNHVGIEKYIPEFETALRAVYKITNKLIGKHEGDKLPTLPPPIVEW